MFENPMYNNYGVQNGISWRQTQVQRTPIGYGYAQQPTANLQWIRVNGPQAARDVSVPPGGEAWIMDESRPVFYFRRADEIGQVVTKAFRFEEISLDDVTAGQDMSQYVTHKDMQTVLQRLDRIDKFMGEMEGINA